MAKKQNRHKTEAWFYIMCGLHDGTMQEALHKVEVEDLMLSELVEPLSEPAERMFRLYERLLVMAKYDFLSYAVKRIALHWEIAQLATHNPACWAELLEYSYLCLSPEGKETLGVLLSLEMMRTLMILDGSPYTQITGLSEQRSFMGIKGMEPWIPADWTHLVDNAIIKKNLDRAPETPIHMSRVATDKDFAIRDKQESILTAACHLLPFLHPSMHWGVTWGGLSQTMYWEGIREYPLPHWVDLDAKWEGQRRYLPKEGVMVGLRNAGSINAMWMAENRTAWGTRYVVFSVSNVVDGERLQETYGVLIPSRGCVWVHHKEAAGAIALFAYEMYLELVGLLDKSRKRKYALQQVDNLHTATGTNVYYRYIEAGPLKGVEGFAGFPVADQPPWAGVEVVSHWKWVVGRDGVLNALSGGRATLPLGVSSISSR